MLAQLEAWYLAGRVRKPSRGVSALSSYTDVAAEYEDACTTLGVVPALMVAAAPAAAAALPAAAVHVVGGRTLRDRGAL